MTTKTYEIHVEMTNRCNLNCIHCSSSYMKSIEKRNFTINNVYSLIENIKYNTHVYLTGGEPLLSEELLLFISRIKDSNERTKSGIFTCGICNDNKPVTKEFAYELKDRGLDDCYVSIYHYLPEVHDKITSLSNSYSISMESIGNLILAGIDVKAHLVINKYNYMDLAQTIKCLFTSGLHEIRLLRIVHTGKAIDNWHLVGVSYEEQENQILELFESSDFLTKKVTVSGFPSHFPCRPFVGSKKCQAGTNVLYVTYEGNIFPCACTKNSRQHFIGHITDLHKIKEFLKTQDEKECNTSCLNPL